MTDEEFREFAEDLEQFFQKLVRVERAALFLSAKVCSFGFLGGLIIGFLVAAGQTAALGTRPAWATYGNWWLVSPLIGTAVPIAIFIVCLIFSPGAMLIERIYRATFSDHARQIFAMIGIIAIVCATVGMLISLPIFMAYDQASRSNPALVGSNLPSLDAVDKAISKQSDALKAFSSEGRELLRRLDGVRLELSQSLVTAESQLKNSEQTSSQISNLLTQQKQIELRMAELQSILGGEAPITKHDLEASSLSGLLIGAAMGFAASLAASFVYGWFVRYLRRRGQISA